MSVEENVGLSQCTGMLSVDAHLNTQARGISLTRRNVNRKDKDAGSLKNFSYLCITGKAASVTRGEIPLHCWVRYPVRDKQEIAGKDKQIFTQMDRVDEQRSSNARY